MARRGLVLLPLALAAVMLSSSVAFLPVSNSKFYFCGKSQVYQGSNVKQWAMPGLRYVHGMCISHHVPCSKVQRIPPAAAAAAVAAASAPALAEEGGGLLDFGKVGILFGMESVDGIQYIDHHETLVDFWNIFHISKTWYMFMFFHIYRCRILPMTKMLSCLLQHVHSQTDNLAFWTGRAWWWLCIEPVPWYLFFQSERSIYMHYFHVFAIWCLLLSVWRLWTMLSLKGLLVVLQTCMKWNELMHEDL